MTKRKHTLWFGLLRALKFVPLRRRVTIVLGLLLSSIFELIGLSMLVPLMASFVSTGATGSTKGQFLRGLFEQFGISASFQVLLLVVVGGLVMKSVTRMAVMTYLARVMSDITRDVRLLLVRNLLNARWSYFVRQPLGRLTNLMGPEANAMGETFFIAATFLSALLEIAVYMAIAFLISRELAVICLVLGLIMFISFGQLVTRTRRAAAQHAQQLNSLAANFSDAIIGIRPIKAMGRQARFAALFETDTRETSRTMRGKVISSQFSRELQEPLIMLGLLGGLYLSTQVWQVHFEHLLLMGLLLAKTIDLFSRTQRIYHSMVMSEAQYHAIADALTETVAAREELTGTAEPLLERQIRITHVSFAYDQHQVLKGISLTIPVGAIVALTGPSGAGKSTLVDLILGFHQPASGSIHLDDTPLEEVDLIKWRSQIGYVPQELTLFHDTVYNNITLGDPAFGEEDVRQALAAADALSFVETLQSGIHQVVGERGLLLSGGQRQRIAIARALIHRPRILVLDEATTSLDPATERTICENIQKLARERQLTVLTISHQATWHSMADIVATMREGRFLALSSADAKPAGSHTGEPAAWRS
jgi:ATP-binding cassette subfamily C protein